MVFTSASLLPCVGHSGEIGENRTEGNDNKCERGMYMCMCVYLCSEYMGGVMVGKHRRLQLCCTCDPWSTLHATHIHAHTHAYDIHVSISKHTQSMHTL